MAQPRGRRAQLLVRLGAGEVRVSLDLATTSLGKDPASTLALSGPDVALRHAIIQREGDHYEIFDLFSESGTLVNGQRVEAAELKSGDQIDIGGVRLVFLLREAENEVSPVTPVTPQATVLAFADDPWNALQEQPFFARHEVGAGESLSSRSKAASDPELQAIGGSTEGIREPEASQSFLASMGRSLGTLGRRLRQIRQPRRAHVADLAAPRVHFPAVRLEDYRRTARYDESFASLLVENLRRTPYFLASLFLHAAIILALSLFAVEKRKDETLPPILSALDTVDLIDIPYEELMTAAAELELPEDVELPTDVEDPEDLSAPSEDDEHLDGDTNSTESAASPFDADAAAGLSDGAIGGLSGGNLLRGGGAGFRKYVRGLRETGLEIVFVIDSTSSMDDVIDEAKRQVDVMIAILGSLVPNFRLGVVTYRDQGDEYVTRVQPLTAQRYQAVRFLNSIEAAGGGDTPEAVLAGLRAALMQIEWKSARRVVVFVADAEAHPNDVSEMRRLAVEFTKRSGSVHALVTATNGSAASPSFDPSALACFRLLADRGKGVCVTLSDHGLVMREILRVAFGAEHTDDADQALANAENDWRGRHFEKILLREDAAEVARLLRRKSPSPLLLKELGEGHYPNLLPAYIDIFTDTDAPPDTRFAAITLIERMARRSGASEQLLDYLAELQPPSSPVEATNLRSQISKRFAAIGFKTEYAHPR